VIGTATSESGAAAITPGRGSGRDGPRRGAERQRRGAAEALIDAIVKEFGALHVLVNNAGITQDQLAMRMKDEDWDAVIDTNLKSVFRLSRGAAPDDEGARRAHHQHHVGGRLAGNPGRPTTRRPRPAWRA
jgi:3-oxoacyl-[acyl-carrier protein] reductase